jgi:hypothetical protein
VAWYLRFAALWLSLRPSPAHLALQYLLSRSQREQMTTSASQRRQEKTLWQSSTETCLRSFGMAVTLSRTLAALRAG